MKFLKQSFRLSLVTEIFAHMAINVVTSASASDIVIFTNTLSGQILTLNGAATVTNECHVAFNDPGATASGAPLAMAGGGSHSLALRSDGTVAAWGDNSYGQTNIAASLSNVVAIAAGYTHSLALKSEGTVVAWGNNGNGRTTIPVGLSNVVAIAAGGYHSLALRSDGTVAVWGWNIFGQTNIPEGLSDVVAIAGGGYHSLALKSDGTVVAWGYNGEGQTNIPVSLSNVVAIAGGSLHSLALRSDGTVAAWGRNIEGQTNIPVGFSNVVAIAGGGFHSLALKSNGTVVAWGYNGEGQTNIPVDLSNVVAIAAGNVHSLALKRDGGGAAWGRNVEGQTIIPVGLSNLPVTVSGSVDTNNPGSYPLTYSVANPFGYGVTALRTVVVKDTTPPQLILLGANPFTNTLNMAFIDPGATASDLCNVTVTVATNSTVVTNIPGSYLMTYIATDGSGNSITNTRTVIVPGILASTPPVLTNVLVLGNGSFQFAFASDVGALLTVWASTNAASPFAQWSNLGAPVESPVGTFTFTDPQATNSTQCFYRVSSP